MKFSENWLRTYVNPDLDSKQLVHRLTMAGLEVEDTRPVAPPCKGVVVAEIVEAVQHPNADRLRICKVLAGVLFLLLWFVAVRVSGTIWIGVPTQDASRMYGRPPNVPR